MSNRGGGCQKVLTSPLSLVLGVWNEKTTSWKLWSADLLQVSNLTFHGVCILLRYNSLPCGTESFTGSREELRPTSKKKRHLFLAVASGCRHVICPFVSTFLVGRRHFTVFGKYLLPFSSYISVQFYCYKSLFMYFIYYCIKHILANFQHFRFCNLSLF